MSPTFRSQKEHANENASHYNSKFVAYDNVGRYIVATL